MQEYKLDRTEQNQLAFTGELLAKAESPAYKRHLSNPTTKNHWFEADIYRTKGGKYIAAVRYRCAGKYLARESPQDYAAVCDSEQAAFEWLEQFDAKSCVKGFPDDKFWEEKQKSLMASIEDDFDTLIESINTKLKSRGEPEVVE